MKSHSNCLRNSLFMKKNINLNLTSVLYYTLIVPHKKDIFYYLCFQENCDGFLNLTSAKVDLFSTHCYYYAKNAGFPSLKF